MYIKKERLIENKKRERIETRSIGSIEKDRKKEQKENRGSKKREKTRKQERTGVS